MKMLRKFMLMGIVLLLPVLAAVEKTYAAEDGMITDLTDKEESPEDGSDTENTGQDMPDKEETDEKETEEVVRELDLGDYRTEMTVGEKQLLIVTVIPQIPDKELSFLSSNTEVAGINGLGRITALHAGQTEITVMCDQAVQSFWLQVSDPPDAFRSIIG